MTFVMIIIGTHIGFYFFASVKAATDKVQQLKDE